MIPIFSNFKIMMNIFIFNLFVAIIDSYYNKEIMDEEKIHVI